jgi:outer membrane receptor for ferrienterochelin and colicins
VTGFASIIEDAVALRGLGSGELFVANVPGQTRTWGGEALARLHAEGVHASLSYTYLRATEPEPDTRGRREVTLTPRHSAGLVVAREWEDAGRVGAEAYYTGRQQLDDNPYRATSAPYIVFGVLAERIIGRARLFINFENIGNVRQTQYDPLLLPQRSADGRWTTESWAPLDGRVVNGGIRWQLGSRE